MLAVTTAGILAAGGLAALGTATARADSPAAVARPAAAISWGACASTSLSGVGAECGFVPVPLDWSEPRGEQIQIAVSRLRAKTDRQGVLLINPGGGPGGSGLDFPALYPQQVPDDIGYQYDWIGFDPRGVGSSRPAVSCDKSYFDGPRPQYEPTNLITLAKEFPFATWGGYWFSGPCTFWPVKQTKPLAIDGSKTNVAIPLLNATHDGPTPFTNALKVKAEFPTSVLVADVGGMTHGVDLNGNTCITRYVADYLRDGTLPTRTSAVGADVECARKPLPEPSLIFRGQEAGAFVDGAVPEPLNSILIQLPIAYRH